jgi:hypothetical protein
MYQSFSFPPLVCVYIYIYIYFISASLICFLYNVVLMPSFSTSYAVKMSWSKSLISLFSSVNPSEHVWVVCDCVYVVVFYFFYFKFFFLFSSFPHCADFQVFLAIYIVSFDMTCIVIEHLTIL